LFRRNAWSASCGQLVGISPTMTPLRPSWRAFIAVTTRSPSPTQQV